MLADVFTSLDGHSPVLWALPFITLGLLSFSFWSGAQVLGGLKLPLLDMMSQQASRTRGSSLGGFETSICVLFMVILLLNWGGMLPYIFSTTSHLILTLSFGFSAWLALVMSSVVCDVKGFLASLSPAGAPAGLMSFLVLVESLSMLIRPLTLSVRLAANMSAGHLIMGLAGAYISLSGSVVIFQIVYTLFEMGVCLVQSYVFALLLTLYSDEHTSPASA